MLKCFPFFLIAGLLSGFTAQAQHEGDNWVFGQNAGMHFNPDSTLSFFSSAINTREGVASISDPITGTLLFYTNGKTAWNRNNQVMPNGTGLLGDFSSAQSSVIIPKPGAPGRYYIFTAPHLNDLTIPYAYSEVDMALNGGLGDILASTKNTPIGDSATEKLTVARHCNNRDFWVIMRHFGGNRFSVRLVTASGVQAPQYFNLGGFVNSDSWNKANYLKLSQDQTLLVHPIGPPSLGNYVSTLEMFAFDNSTGTISGPLYTLDGFGYAYAAEFSADNRLLYVADISTQGTSKVFQFDISSGSAPTIQSTKKQLVSSDRYDYGALQMGPNGKIYAAKEDGYNFGSTALDVIHKPSIPGLGCNYEENGVTLSVGKTLIGLPNIPNYVFRPAPAIAAEKNCTTGTFHFVLSGADSSSTISWTFGDPASGGNNAAVGTAVVHSFSGLGQFTIKAIQSSACGTDTVVTNLVVRAAPLLSDTSFCQGGAVVLTGPTPSTSWNNTVNGPTFVVTQGGAVHYAFTDTYGCLISDSVHVQELPVTDSSVVYMLCPGETATIDNIEYTAPGTVVDTLAGANGACDTIITYTLEVLPQVVLTETVALCPGETFTVGGIAYTAPATVVDTLPGLNGACDSIITYTLDLLPQAILTETVALCPGEMLTIGGTAYTAPATVVDTLPGINGACDSIITYTLELLQQPARAETISFCPGDIITIGGQAYTQAGMVLDTIPATGSGCDTIVTYTLESLTPASSTVNIVCPANIALTVDSPAPVTYDPAQASSDCPCPGMGIVRSAGLASGDVFPIGVNTVCYTATDSCGNSGSCCFSITLTDTKPCDIKVIGCLKFELLSLTRDAAANTTFRIRVTNDCSDELVYTAFQLPKGVVANSPVEKSVYAAPSGREYAVRNPNYSPIYSIRYTPAGTGISGGASDIFEYTLPPNTFPDYINVLAKVRIQTYYEAHLNTFYCPIGITPTAPRATAPAGAQAAPDLNVFPNPTDGALFADLSEWAGEPLDLYVYDSRGFLLTQQQLTGGSEAQPVQLPDGLAPGLYVLDVRQEDGTRRVVRFIVGQ